MRRHLLLFVFLALALSACAKKHVVTQPEVTQLAPPPPPERVVAPTPEYEPPPPPPPKTPEKRTQESQKNVVRQPAEPPKPAEPPPAPAAQPAEQKPQLNTSEADVQRQTAEANRLLAEARGQQDKAKRNAVSPDAREQFNTAVRFITQAEQALTEGNTGLALRLAKNAVTILTTLANR